MSLSFSAALFTAALTSAAPPCYTWRKIGQQERFNAAVRPIRTNALVLSADIGTSSLKAALIDMDGRLAAFARKTYAPPPLSAAHWEEAFKAALAELFVRFKADTGADAAQNIKAVCVSANGPTFVPYTFSGESLAPLLWNDGREERAEGESRSFFLPHAAWFARHEPAQYEKTRWLLSAQEWLTFRLGADPVTALPGDRYKESYWTSAQCALFGVDRAKLPPFVPIGSRIGMVSAQAAELFPLASGTPLVAGVPDFIAALLGTGAVEPGIVCDRAGTSEGVNLCYAASADTPPNSAPPAFPGLRVLPHPIGDLWNIGGIIPESGVLFDRYRAENALQSLPYPDLLRRIAISDAADGVYAEGRAMLMAVAERVRTTLDTFRRNGFDIREMRVSGGQAKSHLWNRIKAKLTDCTLAIPEIADGELAGNACLSLVAIGEADGAEQAISRVVRICDRFEPENSFKRSAFSS